MVKFSKTMHTCCFKQWLHLEDLENVESVRLVANHYQLLQGTWKGRGKFTYINWTNTISKLVWFINQLDMFVSEKYLKIVIQICKKWEFVIVIVARTKQQLRLLLLLSVLKITVIFNIDTARGSVLAAIFMQKYNSPDQPIVHWDFNTFEVVLQLIFLRQSSIQIGKTIRKSTNFAL